MTWCNKFGIHYLFNDVPISLLFILIPCIILYEHYGLYFLHYMWLRCIRSCKKNLSHGFLANRWLVHSQFMGLNNPLEVVMHHRFPMVSALVCMVTHWTEPMVSYDFRLSSNHDFTKLLHCIVSQPLENIQYWACDEVSSDFDL